MNISLNDEWQVLVEEHEQEVENRKQANARQNLFLLCSYAMILVAALIAIGFFFRII